MVRTKVFEEDELQFCDDCGNVLEAVYLEGLSLICPNCRAIQ